MYNFKHMNNIKAKEWYLNKDLRTTHVQKYFNSKIKFFKEYFNNDAETYIKRLKEGLEKKYNVKLI